MTPDQFATVLIHDLDLPNTVGLTMEVSKQIRTQLEEYAGVALHPLFHSTENGTTANGTGKKAVRPAISREPSRNSALTPQSNGANGAASPAKPTPPSNEISAIAVSQSAPLDPSQPPDPDDAYRCIVNLNINLQNRLYTDRFEWSLLHPPGYAEIFAKQTCADMGLSGEWIPAITHAIYEAVLRLKKEACESGGLVGSVNGYGGEIDNMAANEAGAGWRYDHEALGGEWEPKLEMLSKEEIEKKEGDRERQLRRQRRETARFSSSANMVGGMPDQRPTEEETLGRGERSKKKRRYRSLSPPGGGTPDIGNAGYGGGGVGVLNDWFVTWLFNRYQVGNDRLANSLSRERQTWRCSHCLVCGSGVWGVRDGPSGPRVRRPPPLNPLPPYD